MSRPIAVSASRIAVVGSSGAVAMKKTIVMASADEAALACAAVPVDAPQNVYHSPPYGRGTVLSVRLPEDLQRGLDRLAHEERTTKTQIGRRALDRYVEAHPDHRSSFELGEARLGRYGSGDGTLATTDERRVRGRIRAKHPG